jgi:threonine dehydrogenase-like Zn-dependent dehydrogenase
VGQPGMLSQALTVVRDRGTVVLLGNCMKPDTIQPSVATFKEVLIQGSVAYSLDDFETVARLFDTGHVSPRAMLTDTLTYETLPRGFEALRAPTTQCKVMVNPWA